MFDVEIFLRRKGVEATCARLLAILFGDKITLEKATRAVIKEDGSIYFPSLELTVTGDTFSYISGERGAKAFRYIHMGKEYNEDVMAGRNLVVTYGPDKGLVVGEAKISDPELDGDGLPKKLGTTIRIVEVNPIDLNNPTVTYSFYDEPTVEDYYKAVLPDPSNRTKQATIKLLSGNQEFADHCIMPDMTADFGAGKSLDAILKKIKEVVDKDNNGLDCKNNEFLSNEKKPGSKSL